MKKLYNYAAEHTELLCAILIHVFFAQVALCFYFHERLATLIEIFLLAAMPLCSALALSGSRETRKQLLTVELFALVLWLLGILCPETNKERPLLICFGAVCLISGVGILLFSRLRERQEKSAANWPIILLIAVFILLSAETLTEVPMYDCGAYYAWSITHIAPQFDFTLANIKNYCLCSHISVGYGLLTLPGELMTPHSAIGVHIVNTLLAAASVYCFYRILQTVFQEASDRKYNYIYIYIYIRHRRLCLLSFSARNDRYGQR